MTWALALLLIASSAHAGNVLYVDMNGADDEIHHCTKGVEANNPRETVEVLTNNDPSDPRQTITAERVLNKLIQMAKSGHPADSVVFSAEDGNGELWGPNGSFSAAELTTLMKKHPSVAANITSTAMWGCYTANAQGCETNSLSHIGPNVSVALGFSGQAPANDVEWNWKALEHFCKTRGEAVAAQKNNQLENYLQTIPGFKGKQFGVCTNDHQVCSEVYSTQADRALDTVSCYSYKDIKARCGEFDPSGKETARFNACMQGAASCPNPPLDAEEKIVNGKKTKTVSFLRSYYGKVTQWSQCADEVGQRRTPFEMPNPLKVQRLTMFQGFKESFANVHGKELDQYNQRMRALGLENLTLDKEKVPTMTRAEIVSRTKGAMTALQEMRSRQPLGGTDADPTKLLVMARGFDRTLRLLEPYCSDASWVHDSHTRSPCIAPYGVTPAWPN